MIKTKKKVVTNLKTMQEHFVVFKEVTTTYNTNKDAIKVSIKAYREIESEIVVDGETINESYLEEIKELNLEDYYSKLVSNQLAELALSNKPVDITSWTEINNYVSLHGAVIVIANKNILGLNIEDLELI